MKAKNIYALCVARYKTGIQSLIHLLERRLKMTDIFSIGALTLYIDIIIRILLIIILLLGIIYLAKLIFKKQEKNIFLNTRKLLAVILSITISLTITITSTGFVKVYADGFSKHPDTDLIETIRLTGVSKATAYKLAEKVKNGGILDSMNPKYNNMAPTVEIIKENHYEATYVYPDGSINKVRITPKTVNGTISGGNFESGSYWFSWKSAHVSATWGIVTARFYANMQGGSGGIITNVWHPSITILGGTFANKKLWIQNSKASKNNPAEADLYFEATAVNNFGSSTFYLRLYVGMRDMPYARLSVY